MKPLIALLASCLTIILTLPLCADSPRPKTTTKKATACRCGPGCNCPGGTCQCPPATRKATARKPQLRKSCGLLRRIFGGGAPATALAYPVTAAVPVVPTMPAAAFMQAAPLVVPAPTYVMPAYTPGIVTYQFGLVPVTRRGARTFKVTESRCPSGPATEVAPPPAKQAAPATPAPATDPTPQPVPPIINEGAVHLNIIIRPQSPVTTWQGTAPNMNRTDVAPDATTAPKTRYLRTPKQRFIKVVNRKKTK